MTRDMADHVARAITLAFGVSDARDRRPRYLTPPEGGHLFAEATQADPSTDDWFVLVDIVAD